jgi:ribonuclease Z
MNTSRITRLVLSVLVFLFAGLGLHFWISPQLAGYAFDLAALGTAGLTSLRADVGGLFVGLALLCAVGAWRRSPVWLLAAALLLVAVVLGRAVAAIVGAGAAAGRMELILELGAIATLVGCARALGRAHPLKRRKPHWFAAVAFALAGLGVVLLHTPAVQRWMFDVAARDYTARVETRPLEDDALRVAICGSSAPLPSRTRAKACAVVFAGGKFWVIDAGPESVENLVLWGIPLSEIGGVLLTHYHSDHIGDLGELQLQTWAGGRKAQLPVYGGPGVDRVVEGFNAAYRLDQGYRTAHHGEDVMPSKAWGMVAHTVLLDGPATPAKDRTAIVLDDGELRITAIEVDHAPIEPAYAYRFDYRGRSVVITGDLKNHAPLVPAAMDADVLVSEAIATDLTRSLGQAAHDAGRDGAAAIMHDIEDYHITPQQAAAIANEANVKLLVFYHLLPAPDGWLMRSLFQHGIDDVRDGDWTIADDGDMYTLPLGSDDIRIERLGD